MKAPQSIQPRFVTEQEEADRDPVFMAQLSEIANSFSSQRKRVIFISRAWPLPLEEDKFNEQYSVEYVERLARHLSLFGFKVILDIKDLGVGVHLYSAMRDSVEAADHVLLLVTKTYLYKVAECFDPGVSIELSFIKSKIRRMGGGKEAGDRRFVLPLALADDLTGFPLVEGHSGFAAIYVKSVGYRRALIDLATKVYDVAPEKLVDVLPSAANDLALAVKYCYLERKYIPRLFHEEPILLGKGYVRLAIVKEEEQQQKMREQFSNNNEERGSDGRSDKPKLFQDKRLTCYENIHGAKEPIELSDIFKPEKEKNKDKIPKRLLILGRAGIGKSTLCRYMANQWANTDSGVKLWEEAGQEKFKLVVWVPLRNLLDYPLGSTLCDVIFNECISEDHTGEKILSKESIRRGLEELKSHEILYICDGYDEVVGKTTPLIEKVLAQENIILTSRLHGVDHYLTSENAKPFDRKFESIGFLDDDIEKYIRAFFANTQEIEEQVESLITFLKDHPNVWGIAHIPINLMLICVSWKDMYEKFDFKNIKEVTVTNLYYCVLAHLASYFLQKNQIKIGLWLSPREILNHHKCKSILSILSELAFEQMSDESLLLSKKKLENKSHQNYPENHSLREDIINFGLLTPTSSDVSKPKTKFYFVHLTFQEFLAALYISVKLRAGDEEIKQYILQNRYSARHEMVWWFVAGLLKQKDKNGTRGTLEIFFDILDSEPRDVVGFYHQMLLMRCIDECKLKISPTKRDKYLGSLSKYISRFMMLKRRVFPETLLRYLSLSQIVFGQSEIIEAFYDVSTSKAGLAHLIMNFFDNQSNVPEKMLLPLGVVLIKYPYINELYKQDLFDFLCGQRKVPVMIENHILSMVVQAISNPIPIFYESRDPGSWSLYSTTMRGYFPAWLVNRFLPLLTDSDPMKRVIAVTFFSSCREKSISKDVKILIATLINDSDPRVRAKALEFGYCTVDARDLVAGFLEDSDWKVKRNAIRFLATLESISLDVEKQIADLLSDPCEYVRSAAVSFFGDRANSSVDVSSRIAVLINDSGSHVRKAAVEFFCARGKSSVDVSSQVAVLINDSDRDVRKAAIEFFCVRENTPENFENCMIAWLDHPDKDARIAAIECLRTREKKSEKIESKLVALLEDSDGLVRHVAFIYFGNRYDMSHEQVENHIAPLLASDNKEVRARAIEFFANRKNISEGIENQIADLLCEDSYISYVINFFCTRKNVSEQVEKSITLLLADSSRWFVKRKAIEFFNTRKNLSGEVENRIASLLDDSHQSVVEAAIEFFCAREDVSEENQKRIVALFCAEPSLRDAAFKFMCTRKEISEEVQNCIADLLNHEKGDVSHLAIKFFGTRAHVSHEIEDRIATLLKNLVNNKYRSDGYKDKAILEFWGARERSIRRVFEMVERAFGVCDIDFDGIAVLFENISTAKIIEHINQINKKGISNSIMKALAYKLLVSNMTLYQCEAKCLQTGAEEKIWFDSKKDMIEFVKNFKRVLVEFTGLDFDERAKLSGSRAVARVGLLPSPRVIPGDENAGNRQNEKKKACVIC